MITLKLNIQKCFRVIAPVFLAVVIAVTSALPAFAFSQSIPAGTYAFAEDIGEADTSFLVNINFNSGGVDYKGIIFRTADPEASFQYAGLYYITASNGTEDRVAYWINGETYWVGYERRVLIIPNKVTIESAVFYAWFIVNAGVAVESEVVDPWGDYTAGQLNGLKDKVDQNQDDIGSIEDAYGRLPLPNVNPDDYNISIWLETEYQALTNCIGVLWESPLIMNILACLGSFLLVSFLVFGGKS